MIFDKKVYYIACDSCRKILSDKDGVPLPFDLNLQAIDAARRQGWTSCNGKELCPDCQHKHNQI